MVLHLHVGYYNQAYADTRRTARTVTVDVMLVY